MKRSAAAAADPRHHLLPSPDSFIEYFPQGLKVLLVGTDDVTQSCIETQLPRPYYQITKCPTGTLALEFLQVQAHHSCDLVLSDVFLKDMDGYQFIRDQHLTTNIPHVVILSGSERSSKIVTAYRCGACYVLWKRLMSASELRNLWQHVCRRREQRQTETDFFNDSVVDDDHQQNRLVRQHQHQNQSSNSSLVAPQDQSPNEVENDSEFVNNVGEPSLKRRRVVWTDDLHAAFVDAVNQLGPEKAVPKTILEAMNVPFLTRENIASHLQKYREKEKRQHHQDIINPMPLNRIALSGPGGTSYGRFGNNNNNNEALAHVSAQPASSIRHPDMLMFHHPPQNPNNNPHLLEPSTTNSIHPPNPYQSHFTAEDVALWFQANLYHHFARQQMQPPGQNFDLGRVVPLAMAPGSNMQQQQITQNLVSGMQELDPNIASGSSYGCNMQQLDQNLALGTSYGNNIQQLNQNLADSNGIMNQNLGLGTSFGSNMQQQQQIIQNFTSSMQQLNQNPVSGSSYGSNIQQQQITQNPTSGMQQLDQNLALVSSYGRNMQLDQNPVPGSSYGNNMQQQQFDQNLASGSCYITTTRSGTNGGIVKPEATPVRDHDEFCGNPDNHQFDQATSNTDVIEEDLDDFLI